MENIEKNFLPPDSFQKPRTASEESQIEKEKKEKKSQCQEIFNGVYEQLKPQVGTEEQKIESARKFIEDIAKKQSSHIEKIDESETVDQSIEKLWTEGIGKNLTRYYKSRRFEQKNKEYSKIYIKIREHIQQLTQSGEVDSFTAKVFLENFRALDMAEYYNRIVKSPEEITSEKSEKYHEAFNDLYSGHEEVIEKGGFYHFNSKGSENEKVSNRVYLSANLAGSPEKLIYSWKKALEENGLQDKIYFKLSSLPSQRYETIIVYKNSNISDEEMGKVIETFHRLCPKEACTKKGMPSGVSIADGISYAPEPKNLNKLFRAMNFEGSPHDEAPMRISYNQMIAGLVQLSFELAYKDFVSSRGEEPSPKNLKGGAEEYFEKMIKLARINPETMVPNAQGGKLPSWAEKVSNKEAAN